MSAILLVSPAEAPGAATGRRSLAAVTVAALLGVAAAALLTSPATPPRVAPTFPDGVEVVDSSWGSIERFGVAGSHILRYEHDTSVQVRLPWDGGPVVGARLSDDPVRLLTVTDVEQDADELVLTLYRGNCRYFHERAIDIFAGVDLTLASGATTELLFDRPLFVKSPMLASCPDRTLDRQDDTRGGYDRYDR